MMTKDEETYFDVWYNSQLYRFEDPQVKIACKMAFYAGICSQHVPGLQKSSEAPDAKG